jgi:ribose/xylose/arabinose/galactoside ABC-type transport system permease subunit
MNAKGLKFITRRLSYYDWLFFAVIIVSLIVLAIVVPNFLSVGNILNVFRQATIVSLLAIGVTPVLISRGIDISLVSIMAAAGIIGTSVMKMTNSTILGIATMLAIGMIVGAFNGFCVAKLKMVPFIVTLSSMTVTTGFAIWYTKAESIFGLTAGFANIATGRIGPIPIPIIILVIVGVIIHLILTRSFLGRWLYAAGVNPKAAKAVGIPTEKITFAVFILAGFFAGFAAIIMTGRLGSASPAMAKEGLILDYISAAVIGGVSIYGGKGSAAGAILGALLITILGNSMNLLGVSYFTSLIVKGFVIIFAVGLDALRQRNAKLIST